MTMNPSEFADSDLGRLRYAEYLAGSCAVDKARFEALHEAVWLEHELSAPVVPDKVADHLHQLGGDPDRHQMTADEWAGNMQLIEEAIADRILRNAQRFYDWLHHGYTPEQIRELELREIQDGPD
jgi:hypothetical protein